MRQVNGIPLALLSSAYAHVEESGVATALPERWAVLLFHTSGSAFLLMGRGDQEDKAYEAKFSYSRGVLDLRFASREFARSASFPLDLAASQVTMPFQVFSAGKGMSTWEREGSDDRLLDNVNRLCDAIVRARKPSPDTTTILLADYLEPFVHPAGTPEIDVSPAPRIFSMTSFELVAGSLGVEVEEPGKARRFGGTFASCFDGVGSDTGSSPCTGSKRMTCVPNGCRCWSVQSEIRVVPGKTTLTGSCERAIIDEVSSRHVRELRSCYGYSWTMPKKSSVAGKVAASFSIDSTGTVSEVNVAQSTMNKYVDQCIRSSIWRWKFPEPKGGGACTINYTFVFQATGDGD
jgi:TonB family protein